MSNPKVKIARLSIFSNTLLIILKFIVGIVSGSVSILSEAIHSSMDLVAAVVAFFSVRVSDNPPDERHPYGHGKFENISGVLEALLIFAAAVWIIYEAIKKLTGPQPVESLGLGSVVMFISAAVNIIVSRKLYKVARETDSVALEADALHLKTDVITSLGVGVGLLLILITKVHILDPIIAILVALVILKESYDLLHKAFAPLLDSSWKNEELENLKKLLSEKDVRYHKLRTRRAGSHVFLDLHLEMNPGMTLQEVHSYCDSLEEYLQANIKNLHINIHPEPLDHK